MPSEGKAKAKAKAKVKGTNGGTKGKKKGKGAAEAEETHRCFHCQSEGAKMCCSQCHRAWYCGQPCQKKHWKLHKKSCIAAVAAEARQATRSRVGRKTINTDTCVICIGPVVDSVGLPCGHAYCKGCISELRKHKCHSAQTCPLCRTQLPPGLDGLFDLAFRAYTRVRARVDRGELSWDSLPAGEREEMEDAIAMLREATAQGHPLAPFGLGLLLSFVLKDMDGAEAAYRAAIAADPGHSHAHSHLGVLLLSERDDIDGAEAEMRAAIAAWPQNTEAHHNLGFLLMKHRKDVDAAEASYLSAIEANPLDACTYGAFGSLLRDERKNMAAAEMAFRAAIEVDPEDIRSHNHLYHLLVKKMRSDVGTVEAALRAAIAAIPGYAPSHYNLGILLEKERKDFDGAEAAYRAAIVADPGLAVAHDNLANLLHNKREDMDGTEAALRAAITANPRNAHMYNKLGDLLYKERNDVDGAAAAYRKAIAADPGYADAHLGLGGVLTLGLTSPEDIAAADLDTAEAHLRKAAALYSSGTPSYRRAHLALGNVLYKRGYAMEVHATSLRSEELLASAATLYEKAVEHSELGGTSASYLVQVRTRVQKIRADLAEMQAALEDDARAKRMTGRKR
eukprot:CAMPEP_0119516806 /NCGR_PEP_ID=MMETSP1344-20130328/33891_1 /TAXON_ID=236787 /ORGANISM="Florenciella parvula, Strain CCMP2471" /LENGTH=621 /DNA_ID=CAMNT_0007554341 /DNA_START=397 /DNA_END=2262 /DNA_ORIENTATION=-